LRGNCILEYVIKGKVEGKKWREGEEDEVSKMVKEKQSRYRPGVAQRVPGS
jgi:hypothetical protein